MLPAPDHVFRCPRCRTLARRRAFISWGIYGPTWTDGQPVDPPFLPWPQPRITRCRACAGLFWIGDAKPLGFPLALFGPPWFDGLWKRIPLAAEDLPEADWHAALAAGLGSDAGRERYLRVRAWQVGNEAFLEGSRDPAHRTPAFLSNLERLFETAGPDEPGDLLLRAEVARELGRFDAALALLDDARLSRLEDEVEFLRERIRARDVIVRPFPGEGYRRRLDLAGYADSGSMPLLKALGLLDGPEDDELLPHDADMNVIEAALATNGHFTDPGVDRVLRIGTREWRWPGRRGPGAEEVGAEVGLPDGTSRMRRVEVKTSFGGFLSSSGETGIWVRTAAGWKLDGTKPHGSKR